MIKIKNEGTYKKRDDNTGMKRGGDHEKTENRLRSTRTNKQI